MEGFFAVRFGHDADSFSVNYLNTRLVGLITGVKFPVGEAVPEPPALA